MEVLSTAIEGHKIIRGKRHGDRRGFFVEGYNQRAYEEAGLVTTFVQDNISLSAERGTLRGLHYQSGEHAQTKLKRCLRGRVLDVVLDLRRSSPSFGKWAAVELSGDDEAVAWIPKGCANGFATLEDDCLMMYKVDAYWAPGVEGGVRWNDPALAIDWRLDGATPILSEKDHHWPSFADLPRVFE